MASIKDAPQWIKHFKAMIERQSDRPLSFYSVGPTGSGPKERCPTITVIEPTQADLKQAQSEMKQEGTQKTLQFPLKRKITKRQTGSKKRYTRKYK